MRDLKGGGSLSAFVNMCLCLGHLHRAMRASICRTAKQIQSQSFARLSRSLSHDPTFTLPHLTVILTVGELYPISQNNT